MCSKVAYFLFNFVITLQITVKTIAYSGLTLFHLFINLSSIKLIEVWQFILSSYSHSQSGIPSKASPSPGTTKELFLYLMPLLTVVTLHIPICGMCELLYACKYYYFVYGFV